MGLGLFARESTTLSTQNVRGLTTTKQEILITTMQEHNISIMAFQETWGETPDGPRVEDWRDGFTFILHAEKKKSCSRGRKGVGILLNKSATQAWEHTDRRIKHDDDARVLAVDLALEGTKTLRVASAYAPTTAASAADRQEFYSSVESVVGSSNDQRLVAIGMDGNASMGTGRRMSKRNVGRTLGRPVGPFGLRHWNHAGDQLRAYLASARLCSAASFFRTTGNHYATWDHPRSQQGYMLDHWIVPQSQLGRVRNAKVAPVLAVDSDHKPVMMVLSTGRMRRTQHPPKAPQPNVRLLRDPDIRAQYASKLAGNMNSWTQQHPQSSIGDTAAAWRTNARSAAIETCGRVNRRAPTWFATHRENIMEAHNLRNTAWQEYSSHRGDHHLKQRLKQARKHLKKVVRQAKLNHVRSVVDSMKHGQGAYWEAVKELQKPRSGARVRRTQTFNDAHGNRTENAVDSAAAAAEHFNKVYNIIRDRPAGSDAIVSSMRQRHIAWQLDEPFSQEELHHALRKAKPGRATSNQIPVELYKACMQNSELMTLLLGLINGLFLAEEDDVNGPAAATPPCDLPETDLKRVRIAQDTGCRIVWQEENPKLPGSASHARYEQYKHASTYQSAIRDGALHADIRHDLQRGYLQIWTNSLHQEHPLGNDLVGAHFCDSSDDEEYTVTTAEQKAVRGITPGMQAVITSSGAPHENPEKRLWNQDYVRERVIRRTADDSPPPTMPQELNTMQLRMIPKKGDLHDLNNWRGIMLLDAVAKLLSTLCDRRLGRITDEEAMESQNGFTSGRGGTDAQFCLNQVLKKRREHGLETWTIFFDLVKAFDSARRDLLWIVLVKLGVPPRLLALIQRLYKDLVVEFEVGSERVRVPNNGGVKQGENLAPKLFLVLIQACMETLPPGTSKCCFRTNTRRDGGAAGHTSGNNWHNVGEFSFLFSNIFYADDAASADATRTLMIDTANSFYSHLKVWGLEAHVGDGKKDSKTVAMAFPRRGQSLQDVDTSDIILTGGGVISFVEQFSYLGSLVHWTLSDSTAVRNRIKKASAAFGALRECIFATRYVPLHAKATLYKSGVLSVLLYGCESWSLKASDLAALSAWHNACLRTMCRITMLQVREHRISNEDIYTRTGVKPIEFYFSCRTLQWAGHVARMPLSRLPRRLLTSWIQAPRLAAGQEMTYGRSLRRCLRYFDLPEEFASWAQMAMDKKAWVSALSTANA